VVVKRKRIAFEKLDEWEKLGLDWDDYHPNAKDVVPVTKLWDSADEFAPNGNDTGADTLGFFADWNKRNSGKSTLIFLKDLLKNWEVDIDDPYESEYSSFTYFQTVVGLAFASAKLRGECEQLLKEKALLSIQRYLDEIAGRTEWEHRAECERTLKTSMEVITDMPNEAL